MANTLVLDPREAEAPCAEGERFAILEAIGAGGTSCVWRARDAESGGVVALKALHATCASNATIVARFEREAELASLIRHANVAVMHGMVEQAGTRYLCMEYVEGDTLGAVLASKNRLPLDVALGIFRQVCDGVQAAHDVGVIHRDLKPDNVLIARRDGRAVILDFGIAKTIASGELTQAGLVIGSIHYMSPEQLCGGELTSATDVYSLGVILYELVTGACPFRAPDLTLSQCMSLRRQAPDPRERSADVPEGVANAIVTCLSPEPGERFPSVKDLRDFLDARCGAAELEPTGLTLYVDGREVRIGRPAEAVVAMAPGEERDRVADRLARIGCVVTIARNGAEALQRSFDRRSQLLVMSEGLEGLDPFTACRIMRRFARWDSTRALVLVDARDPVRLSHATEAGASDVGTLPLQVHAFARQARRLLEDAT